MIVKTRGTIAGMLKPTAILLYLPDSLSPITNLFLLYKRYILYLHIYMYSFSVISSLLRLSKHMQELHRTLQAMQWLYQLPNISMKVIGDFSSHKHNN